MPSVNEEDLLTLHSPFETPDAIVHLNIPDYLLFKAAEHVVNGKTTYLVDNVTDESDDYRNFEDLTRRVASALNKRGLRKGDVVVYTTFGIVHNHVFFTGVWRANGSLRSCYSQDIEERVIGRIEESKARWVLCNVSDGPKMLSIITNSNLSWPVEVITMGEVPGCTSFASLLQDDGMSCPTCELTGKDPAFILQTSGTTGRSKGAILTHEAVLNMTEKFLQWPWGQTCLFVFKGDQIRGATNPIATFAAGSLAVSMLRVSGLELLKATDKYRPKFVRGSPTWLLEMLSARDSNPGYDLSSVEIVSMGGVCITPALQKKFLHLLPNVKSIMITYGMTECTPVAISGEMHHGEWRTLPGIPKFSVGKLAPHCSVQIRDVDTNQLVGPYHKGEICIQSNTLFSGYFNQHDETVKAFINGWMKTGDYGYFDEQGFLFVVDRCKETFKYNGNHISPTELEDVICQHPDVALASVFGVPDPEGLYYIPRAVVTLKRGAVASSEEIKQFAHGFLPNYQHLRGGLYIVHQLPLGKSGKISRQLVAKLPLGFSVTEEAGDCESHE